MKSLILVLFVFLLPSAHAEVEVIDTSRVFEDLRIWTPGLPFEQAFTCGDSLNYSATVSNCTYRCTDQFCSQTCSEATTFPKFNYFVEDCSQDTVHIYGENGFSATVTKADYVRSGNNWLIALLKAHPHFIQPAGRVELNFSSPRSITMIKNGKKVRVRGSIVIGSIFSQDTRQGFGFEAFVLPNEKGLNQIGYFRAGWEDIFMKQRGVIDDPTNGF